MEMNDKVDFVEKKSDEFRRVTDKLASLEDMVSSLANEIAGSRKPRVDKREPRRSKKVRKRKDFRKIALDSQHTQLRVSSLDLLANVVSQFNGGGPQTGLDSISSNSAENDSNSLISATESWSTFGERGVPHTSMTSDFGVMCSYSIITQRGLKWVASKSLNSDIEIQHLSAWYHRYISGRNKFKIFERHRELQPLPNIDCLKYLVKVFNTFSIDAICPVSQSQIEEILQLHIMNEASVSKTLTLNAVCALVCNMLLNCLKDAIDENAPKPLRDRDSIYALEQAFASNCLIHYNRISMVPDGTDTLQAILTFVIYTDYGGSLHASFMMVTTAIRLAQNLGLHAEFTYDGMDTEMRCYLLKVWAMCRAYDMKLATILGSPPIVAEYDTTSEFPIYDKCFDLVSDVYLGTSSDPKVFDSGFANELFKLVVKISGFAPFAGFHIVRMSYITARIYKHLYTMSANAKLSKQLSIAKQLLTDLHNYRLSLPPVMRPFSHPSDEDLASLIEIQNIPIDMCRLLIITFQYTFYMSLMLVQKSIFKIQTLSRTGGKVDTEQPYESVSTARSALRLALHIHECNMTGLYSTFQWSITLAFFDIFVFTLSKQENDMEYEEDLRMLACLNAKIPSNQKAGSSETSANMSNFPLNQRHCFSENILSNFKYMINILRNTFEAKYCKKLRFDEDEEAFLAYSPMKSRNMSPANEMW
ncbi:LAMI_0F16270g1_1 [Lachancea mirantina]|uniref:LAMI_0F16270g1_1 n=1 Tax=Lachancea mirantina TaxID=1230905 RepID=A0A1G4K541_9SACH|nr:LAMI_0F16270g1_1 [Lachancea mirantina]